MPWTRILSDWPARRLEHAFFALLTLVATFGINPYLYGLYNHCVTVPFVYAAADPALYPGDPMIAEQAYFYTWFLGGLAALYQATGLDLEWVFLIVHVVAIYATFWSFFHLARTFTGRRAAAAAACLLLLFGARTLGYVFSLESHLMERVLILPLEFLALAWMLRARWVPAFAAIGLSFCIHPLSAFYVGVLTGAAGLWHLWENRDALRREAPRFLLGLAAGALAAAPSLWLKATGPEPVMPMGTPIDGWLDILGMRSAYHVFPFRWPWHGWLRAALFWVGVGLTFRGRPTGPMDRKVLAMAAAFGGMALAGTVFTEFLPLSIVVQFQFFRAYRFVWYFGMIWLAAAWLRGAEGRLSPGRTVAAFLLAAPAWTEMVGLKYATMAMTWFLLLGATFVGARRWGWTKAHALALAIAFPLMVTPASLYLRGFSLYSHQEADWRAVQLWARDHTPVDAGFIVPPNRKGFRVDSRRTTWVDWNDGTQAFFNQAFGTAWRHRMERVGFNGDPDAMGEGYRALDGRAFQDVAADMPANGSVYAVLFPDMAVPFEEVYANDGYRVVRVR